MRNTDFEGLDSVQRQLLIAAFTVMGKAYSPYSNFRVGAAILTVEGETVTGANVENSSYGLTICAERTAAIRAVMKGRQRFRKLAVIARREDGPIQTPVVPCGACRQFIFEFVPADSDIEVIMSNTDRSRIIIAKLGELLPLGFGPERMKL